MDTCIVVCIVILRHPPPGRLSACRCTSEGVVMYNCANLTCSPNNGPPCGMVQHAIQTYIDWPKDTE
jgi:hypothetical protein